MPVELTSLAKVLSVQPVRCSHSSLFIDNTRLLLSFRYIAGTSTNSLHGQTISVPELPTHNAGTNTNSSHGQLEEACCQRLNSLAEVLSVGVACSLKGPPSEQIIKLLGTMYRLLKSATLLTKAPQSGSPPAFHTLIRNWACHLACLPFILLYETGHVIGHVCISHCYKTPAISGFRTCIRHWACHDSHLHFTFCGTEHSTLCVICISVVADC